MALVIALLSSVVSGQQPKRSDEPYRTPILPAEQAWSVTLPSLPSAPAAMDAGAVYVPLDAVSVVDDDGEEISTPPMLVALERETGATRWAYPVATRQPPVVAQGVVIVATDKDLRAVDPHKGEKLWSVPLDRPVRAPIIARGSLLLILLEGEELLAFDIAQKKIAWRSSIGETGEVLMTADDRAVYLATADSKVLSIKLTDGSKTWDRTLEGRLSEPMVDRGRLYVGSDNNLGALWSLDADTGRTRWDWNRRGSVFGGAIIGTAAAGETVFVLSKDNMLRALSRGNGAQLWQESVGARPILPPQVFEGVVVVASDRPTLSTFRTDADAALTTWSGPESALLLGPPLIDEPRPLSVAIVALFQEGRIIGLRPTAMLFKEPALAPLPSLPGKELPRER